MAFIDPKSLGLSSRDRIKKLPGNQLALIIDRKSRIVMADGRRILEKIKIIQELVPNMVIVLKTSAPVCSKTMALFYEHGIRIEPLNRDPEK